MQPILRSKHRLARIGAACGATDLRFISAYVSLKRAGSPALAWHQDWWCWDHPISQRASASQIAVICYLHRVDRDDGALRVFPKSHRTRTDLHHSLPEAHSAEARQLAETHPAMLSVAGETALPAQTGDAVILDYRLLHGTYANRSDHRRDAVLLSFVPDWTALPPEIQEHLALHPALPGPNEAACCNWSTRERLFPDFADARRSLVLDRSPAFGLAAHGPAGATLNAARATETRERQIYGRHPNQL